MDSKLWFFFGKWNSIGWYHKINNSELDMRLVCFISIKDPCSKIQESLVRTSLVTAVIWCALLIRTVISTVNQKMRYQVPQSIDKVVSISNPPNQWIWVLFHHEVKNQIIFWNYWSRKKYPVVIISNWNFRNNLRIKSVERQVNGKRQLS